MHDPMNSQYLPDSVKEFRKAIPEIWALRRRGGEAKGAPPFLDICMMHIFRSIEIMLRELCGAAKLELARPVGMGQMAQSLRKAKVLPPKLDAHLTTLVSTRNMFVHAMPGFAISLSDLEVLERQTKLLFKWYLTQSKDGPQFQPAKANSLLTEPRPEPIVVPSRRVFLSYASEDRARAEPLYDALKSRGHRPWMDKKDLLPGQEWETEIRRVIEESDFFIACMSTKSITKRGFVQKEIRFALDVLGTIPQGQIYLIPARLEPCDVPPPLSALHWIDLDSQEALDLIIKALESGQHELEE